ncbi:hypothetical protein KM043_005107 [Ampulex compressa]|nr:hypothetical protein KM043_005107 [Ampulex compressa]
MDEATLYLSRMAIRAGCWLDNDFRGVACIRRTASHRTPEKPFKKEPQRRGKMRRERVSKKARLRGPVVGENSRCSGDGVSRERASRRNLAREFARVEKQCRPGRNSTEEIRAERVTSKASPKTPKQVLDSSNPSP